MKKIWIWICGGKPAVIAVPAVQHNNAQGVAILLGIVLAGCLWWMFLWRVSSYEGPLPSWGASAQAQSPAPTQQLATNPPAPAKAEVPPTPTVHFTEGDVFTAGNGNAISRNVIINPNAHEVKSTSRETLKLAPNSSVEVVVPLGASARWETQRTVLNEWQDFDLVWHTHNRGESHPKVLRALRFTSGTEREEVRVVFTGL